MSIFNHVGKEALLLVSLLIPKIFKLMVPFVVRDCCMGHFKKLSIWLSAFTHKLQNMENFLYFFSSNKFDILH